MTLYGGESALNTPEWNEDLDSPEVKAAAYKLSRQQELILLSQEECMRLVEELEEESSQRSRQFHEHWGFGWAPGKAKRYWASGEQWTPSKRASLSKSLTRLENRGLIIRNNYKNEPRLSLESPVPKRTTTIKLTDLGRRVAKLLHKQYSVPPAQQFYTSSGSASSIPGRNKDLDTSEVRTAARKLSDLQKFILQTLEYLMQILTEKIEAKDFYNTDVRNFGLVWSPAVWEKSGEPSKEWTPSKRADFSRSLRRLENRGLVIRNNCKNELQMCQKTSASKRTTHVRLTELGRKVARWLINEDPWNPSIDQLDISPKERKELIERRKKG